MKIGGISVELHFDIELATLAGGSSANIIDTSAFPGAVRLFGFDGDDTLIGGPQGDFRTISRAIGRSGAVVPGAPGSAPSRSPASVQRVAR